jgi:hypothetical protein
MHRHGLVWCETCDQAWINEDGKPCDCPGRITWVVVTVHRPLDDCTCTAGWLVRLVELALCKGALAS